MPKFRYSLDTGSTWTIVDATLPYTIPSVAGHTVTVEPIGSTATATGTGVFGLTTLSASINAVQTSGSGMIPVLHLGDSITDGFPWSGLQAGSYPKQMANALATQPSLSGFRQSNDCFMGTSTRTAAEVQTFDPRIVIGTGWSVISSSNPTLGGGWYGGSGAGDLAFTPTQDFDTVEVYYAIDTAGSNGVAAVSVNGTERGTYDCKGPSGCGKLTLTNVHGSGAASTGTISIVKSTLTNVFVIGVVAYNSQVRTMMHINAGFSATQAPTYAGNLTRGYRPTEVMKIVAPKMTLINLGTNDRRQGVTTSAFQAAMQTLITTAKLSGDVAVLEPWDSALGTASQAQMDAYKPIYSALALENGAPKWSMSARYGSYTTWNPLYGASDNLHPDTRGYADKGAWLAGLLVAAI